MNYTKAKIFNMTLKNLGISTGVQSASQGDRNTVVLQEFYETALYKTLNDYDWGFCNTYSELTPTLNKHPHPKFLYCYDYPNNCLKIRELYLNINHRDEQEEKPAIIYAKEFNEKFNVNEFEIACDDAGNKIIFTNISPVIVRYTRLIENETLFPPEFVTALSWYLAFLTASSITGTRTKTSDCMQIYKQMLREATVADANEQHKEDEFDNVYMEARN